MTEHNILRGLLTSIPIKKWEAYQEHLRLEELKRLNKLREQFNIRHNFRLGDKYYKSPLI